MLAMFDPAIEAGLKLRVAGKAAPKLCCFIGLTAESQYRFRDSGHPFDCPFAWLAEQAGR
jgi:hypothetical protein